MITAKARKEAPPESEADKLRKEEEEMLKAVTQRTALKAVQELAKARTQPFVCSLK